MRQLSAAGQQAIDAIAQRHGFSVDATLTMLDAVIGGHGSMAQFDHPEFAGSGQWMRGGMTMVADMFNASLKGKVDALCSDLSNLLASEPELVRSGSFQSQSQSSSRGAGESPQPERDPGRASLFVAPSATRSSGWWPPELGSPDSTGAQNDARYAYFADAGRLAIDLGGSVTVYDTGGHRIGGFAQQQSRGGTLSFSSQHGLVGVASLPVVSSNGGSAQPAGGNADVFASIERLADLQAKGILDPAEYAAKKAELLGRI